MAYVLTFFVLALFSLSSCKSSERLSRERAVQDAIKRAVIDSILNRPKISAGPSPLNILKSLEPGDTLTVFVNLIVPVERQKLEADNQKLEKKLRTWKRLAALFLLIGTGHLVSTQID